MRALPATLAAIAAGLVLAPAAGAVPLVLTNGSTLVNVDTNSLATPSAPVAVTGMQPGEKLVGIDQRPSTGVLYGIGSANRLYVLNPLTGAATAIGVPGSFLLGGTSFGTDFEPTFEGLRAVSNEEQNIRVNPDTGVWAPDFGLDPGDVVAAAYDHNVAGATSTTLFDIDAASGTLLRQGDTGGMPFGPHRGDLHAIGSLGLGTNLDENIGFDIGADGSSFATITPSAGESRLYGINTSNGAATNLGKIGNGATSYRGLAIMPARIRLTSAAATASEGTNALLTVTRNAPAAGPVSIHYSTAAGTGTSGADFTPVSGTVAWGAGESGAKTIAVPIPDNSAAEGDETFSVSLSDPPPAEADTALGAPITTTVTIAGDTSLRFANRANAAHEGGTARVAVRREGLASRAVSVKYATVSGSASASDYTPATGTLSWAAGDSAPKTISIPIRNDAKSEGRESFGVRLLSPAGAGARLGTPTFATVTIAASDPEPVLKLASRKRQRLRSVKRKGVSIVVGVDRSCRLDASLRRAGRTKRIGRARPLLAAGKHTVLIKVRKKKDRRKLRAKQRLRVSATCSNAAGKSAKKQRTIRLRR